MDSDDNQLVIDESTVSEADEMPPTVPTEKDSARLDAKEKSPPNSLLVELVRKTKKTKTKTKDEKMKEKTKENSSTVDKGKSNENRFKISAPSSSSSSGLKKKPSDGKITYFRLNSLTDLTRLNISAKPYQFYNMRLFLMPHQTLAAEMPSFYPAPSPLEDVTLNQLLNWPNIAITVTLRDITFTRSIKQNCERDLVFGNKVDINIDKQENVTATRYIRKVVTNKNMPEVSKQLLDTYVSAISEAARCVDVSKQRLPEIQYALNKIKSDLAALQTIELRTLYSRFPNKHKYMRIFDNNTEYSEQSKYKKVSLRETINPEIVISIDRCNFVTEKLVEWESAFCQYFENIFEKRDNTTLVSLRELFKKCISFQCTLCNEVFEGVLCVISVKAHLARHFNDKNWTCVQCGQSFSQFELTKVEWRHECTKPRDDNNQDMEF